MAFQVVSTAPVVGSRATSPEALVLPLTVVKSPATISLPSVVTSTLNTRPLNVGRNVEIQFPFRSKAARERWVVMAPVGPWRTPSKRPPTNTRVPQALTTRTLVFHGSTSSSLPVWSTPVTPHGAVSERSFGPAGSDDAG